MGLVWALRENGNGTSVFGGPGGYPGVDMGKH